MLRKRPSTSKEVEGDYSHWKLVNYASPEFSPYNYERKQISMVPTHKGIASYPSQVLLFADETVLVTETEENLEHNNDAMQAAVKEHKLAMN